MTKSPINTPINTKPGPSSHLQHQLCARQIPPFFTVRKLQQPCTESRHLALSLSLQGGHSFRQRSAGA